MSDPFSALPPGTSAPDFNLSLLGGGEFRLSQALTSGPVVLAFFKISCPVCQYSFPFFDRLARLLKPQRVAVVGISQDDEQNTALFRRTLGLSLPLALDNKSYAVSRAYRLTNVPTVFDIAPEGPIVASIVSWSKAELEALYRRHVAAAGKPEPLFQPGEQVAEFRPG
jgi:peroxiredoxin